MYPRWSGFFESSAKKTSTRPLNSQSPTLPNSSTSTAVAASSLSCAARGEQSATRTNSRHKRDKSLECFVNVAPMPAIVTPVGEQIQTNFCASQAQKKPGCSPGFRDQKSCVL